MITEPLVITVTGLGALSLPRIKQDGLTSQYSTADSNFLAEIGHQTMSGKRIRSVCKMTQRLIVPDPITAVNDYELLVVHTVIERPEVGFTLAQVQNLVGGHQAFLTSSIVAKMYGRES